MGLLARNTLSNSEGRHFQSSESLEAAFETAIASGKSILSTFLTWGSIEKAGYPNGLPKWDTYLGTKKKTNLRLSIIKLANNQKLPKITWVQTSEHYEKWTKT